MRARLTSVLAIGLWMACADNPSDPDPGPGDGAAPSADGAPSSTDGAVAASNDGAGFGDGSPLAGSRSDFCDGEGGVVSVGADGDCAGEIAERTFQFGLCACGTVDVQSTLTVDAFDSEQGTYGGANISDDGHLGVNGPLDAPGKLTVRGSAFIGGGDLAVGAQSAIAKNAYAAGDAIQAAASTSIGRNAYFDGDVVGRFNIAGDLHVPSGANVSQRSQMNLGGSLVRRAIPAIAPCPCGSSDILDVAALTAWGRDHNDNALEPTVTSTLWASGTGPDNINLPCGRYYLTNVTHGGTLTIRAEGRTVLFIDGDMRVDGGFNLELASDAEVDLFIAGSLSIGAAARFGSPSSPSKVRTYVGGSDTITLAASSVFGGNLYAPRSNVVFGASAELYGALFGNNVSFSGSASVHFDTAVSRAGEDCDESEPDAGVSGPDGASSSDIGLGPPDAQSGPDATTPDASAPDAGPMGCTHCSQCSGTLGCVIPEGQTSGMCSACTSDLDCCPPDQCLGGACIRQL